MILLSEIPDDYGPLYRRMTLALSTTRTHVILEYRKRAGDAMAMRKLDNFLAEESHRMRKIEKEAGL